MRYWVALFMTLSSVSISEARRLELAAQGEMIQAAIDRAAPGDIVHLPAGTYVEPIILDGRDITLLGDGPGQTLLRTPPASTGDAAAFGALVTVRGASHVVIEGISIEVTDGRSVGIRVEGGKAPGPVPLTSFHVSLINGCLNGGNLPGSVGLLVDGSGGPLNVLVQNMYIRDWGTGIKTVGAAAFVQAHDSALTPNLTAAFDNTASGGSQDAELSWWGSPTGPSGAGPGTGDAVLGAGVSFTPWRLNSVDGIPGCGFNPVADNLVTPGPADTCLSTAHPCVTIPVTVARTDNGQMRGFSVTFQLSPELALCSGPGSVIEGTYLSDVNPGTNMQVVDNGGGSYTVDVAILGLPCGATAPSGTLFKIQVKYLVPLGPGTITITSVLFRDCDNLPLPGTPGPALSVPIDAVPTGPVTALSATQIKVGNDSDGTTKIQLAFTTPPGAVAVEVYRASFGNHPEYDDAPGAGSVPAVPVYPPGAPWALTAVTTSGQTDEVTARDFWYYVAFAIDACGNASVSSSRTDGTLNYHLGDTHDGTTNCQGNNIVDTADLSFLGANYGIALAPSDPLACLDYGPTTDFSVDARPTTDNVVDFEELLMLALNYGLVFKPSAPRDPAVDGVNQLWVDVPAGVVVGSLFDVSVGMEGVGNVQGLSVDIRYDPAAVEPVGVMSGELLARQARGSAVLSSRPGNLDVALLGDGDGLVGRGELARMTFRALTDRPSGIGLDRARGRDRLNRVVTPNVAPAPTHSPGEASATRLGVATPNPFQGTTQIPFTLREAGKARVDIFDLQGRRVRSLRDGDAPAGVTTVTWDGHTDAGVPAASGLYFVRLATGHAILSRPLRLVR